VVGKWRGGGRHDGREGEGGVGRGGGVGLLHENSAEGERRGCAAEWVRRGCRVKF